jgi:hypothetical protein
LGKASFNDEFKLNPVVQITDKISPRPIAAVFLTLRPPPIQAEILRVPAGGFGGNVELDLPGFSGEAFTL